MNASTTTSRVPEQALCRVEDFLHAVGCLCLVVIVVLIAADAILRLTVSMPLQIQFELTELFLMPAVSTLSLSRVFRQRAHLSLEIFQPDSFGRASSWVSRAILAISAAFFGLLTWKSGEHAAAALLRNDIYMGVHDWPLGYAYLSIPVGCGVLTLRLLYEAALGRTTTRKTTTNAE